MPAIGASTTGVGTVREPSWRGMAPLSVGDRGAAKSGQRGRGGAAAVPSRPPRADFVGESSGWQSKFRLPTVGFSGQPGNPSVRLSAVLLRPVRLLVATLVVALAAGLLVATGALHRLEIA